MKKTPAIEHRSGCPISFTLDLLGDKWSLLIVRDMMFKGKKYYGDFLRSEEKIATNILSDRLEKLEQAGLIGWEKDPGNGSKYIYHLTEKGIGLLPALLEIILWGTQHDPNTQSPPEFIQKLKSDRKGLVKSILKNFGKSK